MTTHFRDQFESRASVNPPTLVRTWNSCPWSPAEGCTPQTAEKCHSTKTPIVSITRPSFATFFRTRDGTVSIKIYQYWVQLRGFMVSFFFPWPPQYCVLLALIRLPHKGRFEGERPRRVLLREAPSDTYFGNKWMLREQWRKEIKMDVVINKTR